MWTLSITVSGTKSGSTFVGFVAQTTIAIHFTKVKGSIETTWKLGYIYIKGEFLVQKLEFDVSEKLKDDMRTKLIFMFIKITIKMYLKENCNVRFQAFVQKEGSGSNVSGVGSFRDEGER